MSVYSFLVNPHVAERSRVRSGFVRARRFPCVPPTVPACPARYLGHKPFFLHITEFLVTPRSRTCIWQILRCVRVQEKVTGYSVRFCSKLMNTRKRGSDSFSEETRRYLLTVPFLPIRL